MAVHNFFHNWGLADPNIKDPGTGTALPNSKCGIVNIVTGASGETNTLAAPTKAGLRLALNMMTDGGGDRVITVASAFDEQGTTVITLNDQGDYVVLESRKQTATTFRWHLVYSSQVSQFGLADDAPLDIGTGEDVKILWETADANANKLLVQVPAGTAVNVPVIVIGQSIENVDMGIHNGQVDPLVMMLGVGAVTTGPVFEFRKARGTATAPTVVTSGDDAGTIDFYGCVAAAEWVRCASIRADVSGTIATTRGPGNLSFNVATDAAPSVMTERQLITASGQINFTPATDTTFANGTGVIIGHTAQVAAGNVTSELQMHGTAPADSTMLLAAWSADTVPPRLYFAKSRSATIGTFSAITTGDNLGEILAFGDDGVDFNSNSNASAAIIFDSAGTIGADRVPGVIRLQTATDAAPSVLTTAVTIDQAQLVTCAAGLTVTTGTLTLTAGPAVFGEATNPAGTNCYVSRDNTGDLTLNALSGKTINLAINGSDIATLSATVLSFTGTLAATGARVTQAYFTNHTTTNAETVDSSMTVKTDIERWGGDALAVLEDVQVCTFKHEEWLDPSGETKLGILAESVKEPLAIRQIEREDGGKSRSYPGLNMYGLATLNTRAIQQLLEENRAMKKRLEALEAR